MSPPGDRIYTAEAARKAGISKATLLRWLKEGKIPEVARDIRGWRVFTEGEVEKIKGRKTDNQNFTLHVVMDEELPKELVFKKDFPFYRMVSSFMVAVAGSPAVFLKDNPMNFQPEQTIELGGVVYPSMSIKPYQIYRNALNGHISLSDVKRTMCMMLADNVRAR